MRVGMSSLEEIVSCLLDFGVKKGMMLMVDRA